MKLSEIHRLVGINARTTGLRHFPLGIRLRCDSHVYAPGAEAHLALHLLAREIAARGAGPFKVLDYGTGTGIFAIAAARLGCAVVAIDDSAWALRLARRNAALNGLRAAIDFRRGESMTPIRPGETFDLIVASLPYDNALAYVPLERAFYDFRLGMRTALFARAPLAEGGAIVCTYSRRANRRSKLMPSGFDRHSYRQRAGLDGDLYVVKFTRRAA